MKTKGHVVTIVLFPVNPITMTAVNRSPIATKVAFGVSMNLMNEDFLQLFQIIAMPEIQIRNTLIFNGKEKRDTGKLPTRI
jgi:hypothetical protein